MKWIKKFEELSPEAYRTAGKQLIQKGHSTRGFKMIDHSIKIGSGIVNMWFANESVGLITKKEKADDESSKRAASYIPRTFSFIKSKITFSEACLEDIDEEYFLKSEHPSLNIEFYFSPTAETFKDMKMELLDEVKLFTITFTLINTTGDIADSEIHAHINNINDRKSSYSYSYYGIFSDRKSAIYFKKNILSKEIEKYEEKILDLFALTEIPTIEIVKKIIDLDKNIKINNLFRSEIPYTISPIENSMNYGSSKNKLYKYFFPGQDITK
jgi:hypothetical protein